MIIKQQTQKEIMLTDNIEGQGIKINGITDISEEISNPEINNSDKNKSVTIMKELRNRKYNINEKNDINEKENLIKKDNTIKEKKSIANIIDNENNKIINGNIETLFDSDTSLSSISTYESDNISEDNAFHDEIIKYKQNIMDSTQNENKYKTINGSNSHKNGSFDETSSITSLSSLDYTPPSSLTPMKTKRKLRTKNKIESTNNDTSTIESNIISKRKRRRKSSITSISTLQSPNNMAIPNGLEQIISSPVKKRGRKKKITKFNYSCEKLLQINKNINDMWNNLYAKLKDKKQKDFEIPDNIINDFEGLIKNPNNGDYINSNEWNIVKMSNEGNITSFLTSDSFIPKSVKCSKCKEIINEDKKHFCEFCNMYYHYECIKESIKKEDQQIIHLNKPVDILKQAYNLNLSSNYLIHNADFKWCLQKKWICPFHTEKNPIPKPKLKYSNNSNLNKPIPDISSPKIHTEDSSSSKKITHKKKKEDSKTEHSTSTKSSTCIKKRSRNHSITSSTISNNKSEITIKKKENVILKFTSNNHETSSSHENGNNINFEIKKKNTKFDPEVDPDIYIHLKDEDPLSINIINNVIPKESSKYIRPEVRYKATEEQIKLDFIKKVYKTKKKKLKM